MSQCQPFTAQGPSGVADALQKVDCLATDATAVSFGRLFGAHGTFQTALTITLTLYVALLAVNLITGRTNLRVSVLTPRMLTLGLVLTFATSWFAYQAVIWNLAVGGPDEVASVLIGTKGSATALFAQHLDGFFSAITVAASNGSLPNPGLAPPPLLASPANILNLGALIMLLGTVGVLVVCRLALVALLILGPVFIVFALFQGTRGLFEGWLKTVVAFAIVPLLTVVMGSGALAAIEPMVVGLSQVDGPIPLNTAVSVLVASIIYLSLMLLVFKVASSITRGWRLSRERASNNGALQAGLLLDGPRSSAAPFASANAAERLSSERVRSTVASLQLMSTSSELSRPAVATIQAPVPQPQRSVQLGPLADARAQLRYVHHRVGALSATTTAQGAFK